MLHSLIRKIVRTRTEEVVTRILPYITHSKRIIDIGSGTGDIAYRLMQSGKKITPVDVGDFHGPRFVKPIIYDGKTLPFPDRSFDTALLLMVMHHTPDPESVFTQAARVARELVVIETSYTNHFNKFLTVVADAAGNLRLEVFWNSYKSNGEWLAFFKTHGFRVHESRSYIDRNVSIVPFLHILYYLRRD